MSTSTTTTLYPEDKIYSRGSETELPTNDDNLTLLTEQEYADVLSDDAIRVSQGAAIEFPIFIFKEKADSSTQTVTAGWNGQSNIAPSSRPVRLQVWNRSSGGWELLDTDNSTAANTDFDLSGNQSTNLSNYYDSNNFISFRVYQEK